MDWSEDEAEQCWMEILATWNHESFKTGLRRSGRPTEPARLLEGEVESHFGEWTGPMPNPRARSNSESVERMEEGRRS